MAKRLKVLSQLFPPSSVIQFRGPLEFIVPVYGLAEQSATWLSGQTLSEPEKEGKGRLTRGQGSFACEEHLFIYCIVFISFLDYFSDTSAVVLLFIFFK